MNHKWIEIDYKVTDKVSDILIPICNGICKNIILRNISNHVTRIVWININHSFYDRIYGLYNFNHDNYLQQYKDNL
jgi:hypothetical protein